MKDRDNFQRRVYHLKFLREGSARHAGHMGKRHMDRSEEKGWPRAFIGISMKWR